MAQHDPFAAHGRDFANTAGAYAEAFDQGTRPDPALTVSEWADTHRRLSGRAASEPGPWRTARTPYLREIMDCLSPASPVERVVLMKGAQVGGPLAVDTPIPTALGWKTMGSLRVDDLLYDEEGHLTRITGVSEVMIGQACYELVFDDGERIVCDGAHRWPVWDFTDTEKPAAKVLRTEEMVRRVRIGKGKRYRYAIDCCRPIDMPEQDLIIHPYVLGVWLGDGSSILNHVTVHEDDREIADHLRACGVEAEFRLPTWRYGKAANIVIDPTFRIATEGGTSASPRFRSPFIARLRMLDVLGNKHVPVQYLRASREQRLALVRGFMDSDGTIGANGKRCEFANADEGLIDSFVELLRSLGYKPSVSWQAGRQRVIGDRNRAFDTLGIWRVSWTAYREEPMFRLSRKIERMRSIEIGRPWKSRRRRIVDIRPVPSVPVRCIEVDSRSHLYLCGKGWIPTHNTETGNNWIGYVIHHAPGPMLAVLPTVEMAKRNSKQRIDPLIEESPVLSRRVRPARSRDSGNTVLAKEFPGGVLVMTGANSAVGLRSMPVRYLFLDEVDGYPGDVDGEGDPVALAEARTRTFARRKILIVSTPTVKGLSRIEREYEASDQRRYHVPCPHCGRRQWLDFPRLRWEKGRPETAAYVCVACETAIAEHHKTWMLENGAWQAGVEGDGRTAGFHISSLYSPVGWRSWAEIAAAWEAAQGSDAAVKSVKNTELGETWVETGEAPDWQRLYERREDYRVGRVPAGGLFLTAGADVQKDRIEVSVWAWGRGQEARTAGGRTGTSGFQAWLVEHRVLMGDTGRAEVWAELAALLEETWPHESGVELALKRLAIDSGYATQEVYAWARGQGAARVMAVKGVERGSALIGLPTAVDVTAGGKRLRRGVKVTTVAAGIAKLELYNNLRKAPPTDEELADGAGYPAGYVHLPKVDAEVCKQLCSEQLVTRRNRRGYPVREWQKLRERNEALDAYVYARAAAAAVGLDRYTERQWRQLERQLGVMAPRDMPEGSADAPEAETTRPEAPAAAARRPRRRDGAWMGGRQRGWLSGHRPRS